MKRFALLCVIAVSAIAPSKASAGGFFLMDRGVRAAGRGSAFVAGADDPASLYYNPAGLAYSGKQLLFDAALPLLRADYTRIDGGGNVQATVSHHQVPIAIPSIAFSNNFGLEKWTFGLGVWVPNAALSKWPGSVDGGPAPQRYSLISLKGTLLATVGLGVAFRPVNWLSLGATVGVISGTFAAETTMSACDGVICTQPEDPEYDSRSQFKIPFFAAPIASFGAILDFGILRLGTSFDIPYTIKGTADLRARIPSAAMFERSYIESGNGGKPKAHAEIPFPWIFRAGAELRPTRDLRIEGSFVIEGWKRQESIGLVANDVYIRNVLGVGDYQVGPIVIPRHMKNTYSLRLGGEYTMGPITLRAGAQLETSSFDPAYLTVLTLDSKKLILSGGVSLRAGTGVYLDGVFAFSQMKDVQVRDSRVTQPNPIRPELDNPVYIGNGDYHMKAFLIGGGLRVNFDERRMAHQAPSRMTVPVVPTATAETLPPSPAGREPTDLFAPPPSGAAPSTAPSVSPPTTAPATTAPATTAPARPTTPTTTPARPTTPATTPARPTTPAPRTPGAASPSLDDGANPYAPSAANPYARPAPTTPAPTTPAPARGAWATATGPSAPAPAPTTPAPSRGAWATATGGPSAPAPAATPEPEPRPTSRARSSARRRTATH